MARTKQGSIVERGKNIYARISFLDELGVRRQRWRKAKNKSHARKLIKDMLADLEQYGEAALDGDQMIFKELATYFQKHYLVEAIYNNGRKIAGYRTVGPILANFNVILKYFGSKKIRSITRGDIEKFKAARLAGNTIRGGKRSIATVNRELALLSKVIKIAISEGWLTKNPFTGTQSLICTSDETIRQRIITPAEEALLLSKCTGRRKHLKCFLIVALDTGMRRGEMLKLTWGDIDFESRVITIQAFNTKTMKQRQVGMTERVVNVLSALYEVSDKLPASRVFKYNYVRASFEAARREAGLDDLRWHDIRHVYASRLVSVRIPLAEVGRILGHSSPNMTYRYVSVNSDTIQKATAALDEFNNSNVSK